MDGFEEKKWFVYLNDHHEGPLSVAQIEELFGAGRVTPSSFIWAEGMADWKVMTDVPAFSAILSRPRISVSEAPTVLNDGLVQPVQSIQAAELAQPVQSVQPLEVQQPTPEPIQSVELELLAPLEAPEGAPESAAGPRVELEDSISTAAAAINPSAEAPRQVTAATVAPLRVIGNDEPAFEDVKRRRSKRSRSEHGLLKWAVLALLAVVIPLVFFAGLLDPLFYPHPKLREVSQAVSDLSRPFKLKILEQVPSAGHWISLLPRIDDVSPDEYEELKSAVSVRMEGGSPRIAIALSKADPLSPSFYVASNLPEGTQFDLYIEGQPDTLLNQLSFSTKAQATSLKGLGKTATIKFEDGRPIPRGEYMVYASLPGNASLSLPATPVSTERLPPSVPRDIRVLAKKAYFLGGEKDATYASRLKEYHDRVKSRITEEMGELRQFHGTIKGELEGTLWAFKPLPKQSFSAAKRKAWIQYDEQWSKLSTSLNDNLAKWNNPSAPEGYFYGPLFQLAMQAAQQVEQLHQLQKDFVAGKRGLDTKLNETALLAQTELLNLKSRIEEASSAPTTAAGLPQAAGSTPPPPPAATGGATPPPGAGAIEGSTTTPPTTSAAPVGEPPAAGAPPPPPPLPPAAAAPDAPAPPLADAPAPPPPPPPAPAAGEPAAGGSP